jgi:hypothetical protein
LEQELELAQLNAHTPLLFLVLCMALAKRSMQRFCIHTFVYIHICICIRTPQEQVKWLEQELELAQLNAHTLLLFGHHPWFIGAVDEPAHAVLAPIPKAVRLRWLSKMGQCKVDTTIHVVGSM